MTLPCAALSAEASQRDASSHAGARSSCCSSQFPFPCAHPCPSPPPSPPGPLSCMPARLTQPAEAGPAGVDLALGPSGDADHYCSSQLCHSCSSALTEIASARWPSHLLSISGRTQPWPPLRRCSIGKTSCLGHKWRNLTKKKRVSEETCRDASVWWHWFFWKVQLVDNLISRKMHLSYLSHYCVMLCTVSSYRIMYYSVVP